MRTVHDSILQPVQAAYLERTLPARDAIAAEMEAAGRAGGVPIVDPEVGRFLGVLARSIGAGRVLEIGTAIGYSTLWLARGMGEGGRLTTIDPDESRLAAARGYLERAGVAHAVEFVRGKALDVLPQVQGPFDLVFVDAVKEEYLAYVEAVLPKLRTGGLLVIDNLLWSGQVAGEIRFEEDRSAAEALRLFDPWFLGHPELYAQILPVGDGTGIAVKIDR